MEKNFRPFQRLLNMKDTGIKKLYVHSFASWFVGISLIIPVSCFIVIFVLKHLTGGHFLFDTRWLIPDKMGITASIDFNIKQLILLVLVLILLLNTMTVLCLRFETTANRTDCRFSIRKKWKNLAVVFLSSALLLMPGTYLVGKNLCFCRS